MVLDYLLGMSILEDVYSAGLVVADNAASELPFKYTRLEVLRAHGFGSYRSSVSQLLVVNSSLFQSLLVLLFGLNLLSSNDLF